MDVSVLAAVGSFVVSERVLKPKATVLAILGCVLAYDLTTKTHDVSSLRVYRGPALLAFTLIMVAFSLRTWRRNGVACDELLFLPGSAHSESVDAVVDDGDDSGSGSETAVRVGVGVGADAPTTSTTAAAATAATTKASATTTTTAKAVAFGKESRHLKPVLPTTTAGRRHCLSEGDVAAGVGWQQHQQKQQQKKKQKQKKRIEDSCDDDDDDDGAEEAEERVGLIGSMRRRSNSTTGSSVSSVDGFANSWEEDDDERESGAIAGGVNMKGRASRSGGEVSGCDDEELGEGVELVPLKHRDELCPSGDVANYSDNDDEDGNGGVGGSGGSGLQQRNVVRNSSSGGNSEEDESESAVGGGIGSFFFFRNNSTSTVNAAYAPSGPSVVGAALDLSMPILFNFHLFIEAYNHISSYQSETPAKILPLIFLSVLIVRAVFPPSRRGRFYGTVLYTVTAPFSTSRFRDAFLGDVFTSLVRPCQDVLFALSYYVTVIWGTVTGRYGLSESGKILESSWILHNVMLPSAAILPLWWKFLQTLRQSYDSGRRWPYLGNAFKYLTASLVILYGMTHREDRRSSLWIVCFVVALLYQIWWDTVMDWQLFVIAPRSESMNSSSSGGSGSGNNSSEKTTRTFFHCQSRYYNRSVSSWSWSSFSPDSRVLLFLQMNVVQPVRDVWHGFTIGIPHWRQIQIRPVRLYKSESFYWKIFFYNTVCRFTWMLCFIPAYHLSSNGSEITTFSSDTNSYVGVLLPLAEILRRTLWGFLLLERETIRMNSTDYHHHHPAYTRLAAAGTDHHHHASSSCDETQDCGVVEDALLDEEQGDHHHNRESSSSADNTMSPRENGGGRSVDSVEKKTGAGGGGGRQQQQQQPFLHVPAWWGTQLELHQEVTSLSHGGRSSSSAGFAAATMTWYGVLRAKIRLLLQDDETRQLLFVAELSAWAVAFVVFGMVATF